MMCGPGRHFAAWAFFLNPDAPDDDDAEGCMVKSWVSMYTKKNFKPVSNPEWITENMGMFPPVKYKMTNANKRAAKVRNAQDPNGWSAEGGGGGGGGPGEGSAAGDDDMEEED